MRASQSSNIFVSYLSFLCAMAQPSPQSTPPLAPVSASTQRRRWRWRMAKDLMARHGVAIGGVGVIFAILLNFFYLLYVVVPLFLLVSCVAVAWFVLPASTAGELFFFALV